MPLGTAADRPSLNLDRAVHVPQFARSLRLATTPQVLYADVDFELPVLIDVDLNACCTTSPGGRHAPTYNQSAKTLPRAIRRRSRQSQPR